MTDQAPSRAPGGINPIGFVFSKPGKYWVARLYKDRTNTANYRAVFFADL